MKLIAYFRSLADALFHRSRTQGAIEEELASHIQYRVDDLERSGMPAAKQNAGRASSSAAMNDSAKNAAKRWVDSCSRPWFRMCLLASACCAGLPASLLSPF